MKCSLSFCWVPDLAILVYFVVALAVVDARIRECLR
jgi:hypothetical protein